MKLILLPLVLLAFVGLCVGAAVWQAPAVERDVRNRVLEALAAEGIDWVAVEADGREVLLSGVAPTEHARSRAEQIARGVGGPRSVTASLGLQPPPGDPVARCQSEVRDLLSRGQITFASGRAEMTPEGASRVDRILEILAGCSEAVIQIGGYTDSQGAEDANLALSRERAQAVLDYLTQRGMDPERISAVGFGEAKPVADNATAAGREMNRRIEFILWKGAP